MSQCFLATVANGILVPIRLSPGALFPFLVFLFPACLAKNSSSDGLLDQFSFLPGAYHAFSRSTTPRNTRCFRLSFTGKGPLLTVRRWSWPAISENEWWPLRLARAARPIYVVVHGIAATARAGRS